MTGRVNVDEDALSRFVRYAGELAGMVTPAHEARLGVLLRGLWEPATPPPPIRPGVGMLDRTVTARSADGRLRVTGRVLGCGPRGVCLDLGPLGHPYLSADDWVLTDVTGAT